MSTLRRRFYVTFMTTAGITATSAVTTPAGHAGVFIANHCEPLLSDCLDTSHRTTISRHSKEFPMNTVRRVATLLAATAGTTLISVLTSPAAEAGIRVKNHCEPLLTD